VVSTTKLRVAVPDAPSALETATAKVHLATGLEVRPELQEIDHADLIVEMRLGTMSAVNASGLARLVERTSTDLEVLSGWQEYEPLPHRQLVELPRIVDHDQLDIPSPARRAFDDHVPTARWSPGARGELPHWLLAVPARRADDRMAAGVVRRNGYLYRFSTWEAKALRAVLTAPRAA
jgi:hypothetical protein